ncbi:MAG: hypothetical protein MJZ86_03690 [Bacteroidales bacterium]|nr:hypothetical protein [Bacteroidales bacterium]
MKIIKHYSFVFICLIASYILIALAANLLPNKIIHKNIEKSINTYGDLSTDCDFVFVHKRNALTDNFSENIIINQAFCGGKDDLLTSMFLNPRGYKEGQEEWQNLHQTVNHVGDLDVEYYPSYWHGNTFVMRFLFMFAGYTQLKAFFYFISTLLLFCALYLIARRISAWAALLTLLGMLCVNIYMMQFSIQALPVLFIGLVAAIWIIYHNKEDERIPTMFFIVGSATAFFDLLTCPLITWGIPMCTWIMLQRNTHEGKRWIELITHWVKVSILWVLGYAITWFSKWVIGTAVTKTNVYAIGLEKLLFRSSVSDEFSRIGALQLNLSMVERTFVIAVVVILVLLAVRFFNRKGVKTAVLLAFVATVPVAWYLFGANHSYIHYFFTYRTLMVTLISGFLALGCLIDWSRIPLLKKLHG